MHPFGTRNKIYK